MTRHAVRRLPIINFCPFRSRRVDIHPSRVSSIHLSIFRPVRVRIRIVGRLANPCVHLSAPTSRSQRPFSHLSSRLQIKLSFSLFYVHADAVALAPGFTLLFRSYPSTGRSLYGDQPRALGRRRARTRLDLSSLPLRAFPPSVFTDERKERERGRRQRKERRRRKSFPGIFISPSTALARASVAERRDAASTWLDVRDSRERDSRARSLPPESGTAGETEGTAFYR